MTVCLEVSHELRLTPENRRCASRRCTVVRSGLREDIADHIPFDVGETEVAPLIPEGEALVVDPQQMHDGRV